MAKKERSFVVIGLGAFGGTVASALADMGDQVLGIDIDEKRVNDKVEELTHVAIADARDEDALKEAGAGQHDAAIISMGEDLEASILATMNMKLIGVPTIWVTARSRTQHRILSKIGVDRVIRPEYDIGMHVAETLHSPYVADYLSLGNSFYVINLVIPENAELATFGSLRELMDDKVEILGLMRGTDYHAARSDDDSLEEGDRILLLGTRKNLRRLADGF